MDQQDADLTRTAAQILAKAGHSMLPKGKAALAGLVPAMEQLCWQGAPKAAKAAVRWWSTPPLFGHFSCSVVHHQGPAVVHMWDPSTSRACQPEQAIACKGAKSK